jgi:hypothetical protein
LAYYLGYCLGGTINRIALLVMLIILVVITRRWFKEPTRRETIVFKAAIVIAAIVGDLLGTPLSNLFLRQLWFWAGKAPLGRTTMLKWAYLSLVVIAAVALSPAAFASYLILRFANRRYLTPM